MKRVRRKVRIETEIEVSSKDLTRLFGLNGRHVLTEVRLNPGGYHCALLFCYERSGSIRVRS